MAKAKKTEGVITMSETEYNARMAEAEKRGAIKARTEKQASRAAKAKALAKPGWTMFPHTDERADKNVLAEGVYVIPGKGVIEASAVMTERDGGFMPRYRLALNPIFGVNGDTDIDAERLCEGTALKAKHAPEILAALAKAYKTLAKDHRFRTKAERRPKAETETETATA
jgi:hypothetical protein